MTAHDVLDVELYLRGLATLLEELQSPRDDCPTAELSRQYRANTWEECRDGLLRRTSRIRVWPDSPLWPHSFRFEIDCPFKAKSRLNLSPVELRPGPVRGTIHYRRDLFDGSDAPTVAVTIDPELDFFHANHSPHLGLLCLGGLPSGPFPLDILLSCHIYPIVTYQNCHPAHSANLDAARYFALVPEAMEGLRPVAPLY